MEADGMEVAGPFPSRLAADNYIVTNRLVSTPDTAEGTEYIGEG